MNNDLSENSLHQDPMKQFQIWLDKAYQIGIQEPNAMTLANIDIDGKPSARVMLMKKIDKNSLIFFTNYNSRKGKALIAHPYAALLFFWQKLEKQVRIEGIVEKISNKESDEYYHARPYYSRIATWASSQSEVIESRQHLMEKFLKYQLKFPIDPPRPSYWGGFRLIPDLFEFWKGQPSRLHDRIQYFKKKENWKIRRLCP